MAIRTGRNQDPLASESRQFAEILHACQHNDPHEALTSLILWIGIAHYASGSGSIERFARDIGSDQLAKQIQLLREARIADSKTWRGDALLIVVVEARETWLSRESNGRTC